MLGRAEGIAFCIGRFSVQDEACRRRVTRASRPTLTKPAPAGWFGHFMSILIAVLTLLLILVSFFMVLVVLVQKPRADSGLGTAMGGGVAEATFGAETGNVLTRSTIYAAIAFFVLAFVLYLSQIYVAKNGAKRDDKLPAVPASTAPATLPAAAPAAPAPAPAPVKP